MRPRSRRCAQTSRALPELALGIAEGEERERLLEHVARCDGCRRELAELSRTAGDLLTLMPEREPPAGFEARVLERMKARPEPARSGRRRLTPRAPARSDRRRPRPGGARGGRRRLRPLALAGAALAGAAAMAVALTLFYGDDRRLAGQYRAALDGAHGQFFQSAQLRGPDGREAGTVFAYQGAPSWLFYVLDGRYREGVYREQIVTRSGRSVTLPRFRLVAASWGVSTPVPVRDIALVRLVREPRGRPLEARLPVVER